MGTAVKTLDVPVLKNNNAIIALAEDEAHLPEPTACIRCGRCVDVCPMSLIPTYLYHMNEKNNLDGLVGYNTMDCIECGSCAFACPAGKPLVQHMRLAKTILREEGNK